MALLNRISSWLERVLDTGSDDDDAFDDDMSTDEGLLMPSPAAAAPVADAPAVAANQRLEADASAVADAAQPASMEPVSTRPEVKVVNFAELPPDDPDEEDELSEEAAALLAEEAATDEASEGEPSDSASPEPSTPAVPAVKAVGSGASGETPEQEQEAMVTASGSDDILSEFTKQKSEYAEFTDTMENYTAQDLLTDAREVLSLLPKKEEDAA